MMSMPGVGAVVALTYRSAVDDPRRFTSSKKVGPWVGLTPSRNQSGERDVSGGITKAGDAYLRRLLVQCAQYVLGRFGPDCDLRRFGLRLAERGGKNAKRRAVVAVARKLGVLLHCLWKTGAAYEPDRRQNRKTKAA